MEVDNAKASIVSAPNDATRFCGHIGSNQVQWYKRRGVVRDEKGDSLNWSIRIKIAFERFHVCALIIGV